MTLKTRIIPINLPHQIQYQAKNKRRRQRVRPAHTRRRRQLLRGHQRELQAPCRPQQRQARAQPAHLKPIDSHYLPERILRRFHQRLGRTLLPVRYRLERVSRL